MGGRNGKRKALEAHRSLLEQLRVHLGDDLSCRWAAFIIAVVIVRKARQQLCSFAVRLDGARVILDLVALIACRLVLEQCHHMFGARSHRTQGAAGAERAPDVSKTNVKSVPTCKNDCNWDIIYPIPRPARSALMREAHG